MDSREHHLYSYHRQRNLPELPARHPAHQLQTVYQEPNSRRIGRRSLILQTSPQLLIALLTSGLFVVTAWFAQATFSQDSTSKFERIIRNAFKIDITSTLTVLSILSALLSACSGFVLYKALEIVLWICMSAPSGLNALSLLGLSPSTGVFGSLGIILAGPAKLFDRACAIFRLVLVAAVWAMGILLFIRTSVAIEYAPVFTYNVTAGVGPFNGSYVNSYIQFLQNLSPGYKYQVVPYSILAIVNNLVVNPMHSVVIPPIGCNGTACDSYLLTGGLVMTTPPPPTNYTSYPVVEVFNAPATQIEFKRGLYENEFFSVADDCSVYGADGFLIGIQMCVAESRVAPGSIMAGLYVCTNGTKDGQCISSGATMPNLTTTFSVYSRTASLIAARSNFSIMSLTDLGPPTQNGAIDLPAFKTALSWLLDYNASAIPATSSIAETFWTAQNLLDSDYWSAVPYQTLQSILTFPLWQFNANNYGNIQLNDMKMVSNLPHEYYTEASIVAQYTRIIINRTMFVIFLALEATVLGFVWIVLLWPLIARSQIPNISCYPLIDFTFKTANRSTLEPLSQAKGFQISSSSDDADIQGALKDVKIVSTGRSFQISDAAIQRKRALGQETSFSSQTYLEQPDLIIPKLPVLPQISHRGWPLWNVEQQMDFSDAR